MRAAAKRTAFGDLSNTANTFRVSRDDTAMILKTVRGLKENLPPLQENRQTTFQKPAQRPTTGSKILMNSTGNSTHTTTKQPLNDAKSAVPQVTANKSNVARRLSVKKSTQIFKDPAAAPEVSQTQESRTLDDKVPEIPRPVAPVHRALPPLPTNHESRSGPDTQPGPTTNPVDLPKPLAEPLRISAVTLADGSEAFIADQVKVETRESSVPAVQNVEKKLEPSTANAAASMVDYEVRQVPLADHTNLQTAGYLEPARARKLPPVLEPEEYWEEDEQVENYEEEGYVTARSFKSRGDNTTGGATTVLFPKQTQNAKREVALAKQLIEGSKTEEELEDEAWDTTMVAEYSDDIFHYMRELEVWEMKLRVDTMIADSRRSKCFPMRITWTIKQRSNGQCALFLSTGSCRSTTVSTSSQKRSFSPSTTSIDSCPQKSSPWANSSLLGLRPYSSQRSMKRLIVLQSTRLHLWWTEAIPQTRFSRPSVSCSPCCSLSLAGQGR